MRATKSKARKQEPETTKQERQTVIYQMVTDKIVAALNRGDIPWQRPWRPADAQRNIYGRPYSGVNQFLLQMEASWKGYKSPFWMTFNHAKEMGGMVRKGEHATQVILAKKVTYRDPDAPEGDSDNTGLKTFFSLRYYFVFKAEQIDGIELPAIPDYPEVEPIEACEKIVDNMPSRPQISYGGDQAYYQRNLDKVQLPHGKPFASRKVYIV